MKLKRRFTFSCIGNRLLRLKPTPIHVLTHSSGTAEKLRKVPKWVLSDATKRVITIKKNLRGISSLVQNNVLFLV